MSQIVSKFQELGLTLPNCPAPLAAYVPATRSGDTIYVSGQLPSVNGDFSAYTGTVPTELSAEKAKEAAPGSSVHGIFQPRVLEWGAITSPLGQVKHQEESLPWLGLASK